MTGACVTVAIPVGSTSTHEMALICGEIAANRSMQLLTLRCLFDCAAVEIGEKE